MFKRIIHTIIALAFLAGLFGVAPVRVASASSTEKGVSPTGMLNPDGTLNLDGSFQGTLDLGNYNVRLDPKMGPVFSPIAALDSWETISAGGGAFKDYVTAVAVNGTDIYVGGNFFDAGGNPEADAVAKWNGSQWTSLNNGGPGLAAISGNVKELFFYNGSLYVGGYFDTKNTGGGVIANARNLARWNGIFWAAVPGITANLNAIVEVIQADASNNILYFGGSFTNVNGNNAADRVAGVDLDTSSLVVLGNNGAGDGAVWGSTVYALGVNSTGQVYVGGNFTNVINGGTSLPEADHIAKWDGTNWSALGNQGAGIAALGDPVFDIAIDASDNVYAGGAFADAGGVATADYIAKWNGSAWSGLGSNGTGNGALADNTGGSVMVQDILLNGTDIYVSGNFLNAAAVPAADLVARFNTASNAWSGLGGNGAGSGALQGSSAYGLAFSAGKLYVSGAIFDVNNNGTVMPSADYFAIWDGVNWSSLGASDGPFNNGVFAMAVIGSDVYVGGMFQNLGGDPRMDFLVRWDGSAWNPVGNLTQTRGALNGSVYALAVDGNNLYAGGLFTTAYNEGNPVPGTASIAKWDGSAWSALGTGLSGGVFTLTVDSNHNLYAGGPFTNAASIPEADYIAKWNGAAWSALSGNGASNGALNLAVNTLAFHGTDLYVGGAFTAVVDTFNSTIPNAGHLAKWNGSVWSAMDGITAPLNNEVHAIAVSGNDVYVGGVFNNLNGIAAADMIAKWDGANWSALGADNFGEGSLSGYVKSILVNGKYVYAAGAFSDVKNGATTLTTASYIARWDGSTWSALGSDGASNGSLGKVVRVIQIINSDLWVGGDFQNVNNGGNVLTTADSLAAFGIDVAPTVASIVRANPNPTAKASVDFTVTFSETVTGVDAADFTITKTGSVSGATVSGVSGSGAVYTVSVNTGAGSGTIRLDLNASGTGIVDSINNPSASGFTSGQVYTIKKSITFKSDGANDGWILESSENSGAGGTMNSSATTFNLGDDAARKQYRAILHFDTSSLPDNATITKVTLKIKKQGLSGTNPFTILGGLTVDMRKPSFGALTLGLTDFKSAAGRTAVATFGTTPAANWYSAILSAAGRNYVNKTGTTQFRLRFATDDNNNAVADFMKFFSGNAAAGSRPQLIVEYKVP